MRIRPATPADAGAIAQVHVASWHSTYTGIIPAQVLESLSVERRARQWASAAASPEQCVVVAEQDDGALAGFAAGGPRIHPGEGYPGELYAIYLLAEYQGRGVGRALAQAVRARLQERGLIPAIVWVLADNHPARRFYEALGGTPAGTTQIEIGPARLDEVAYGLDA